MKQILYLLLFMLIPITDVSSQENKSRFGVEVDIIPWYHDTFSKQYPPFSIAGFVGVHYEHFFSNSFSLKTTVGVNQATQKWWSGDGYHTGKKKRTWQTTLVLTVEPRFYFWDKQQKWGNLFAGLPVSIETGEFQNDEYYKSIFQNPTIRAIPVVGYQYYFTPHLFTEVNAGLGWRLDTYLPECSNDLDYLLGVRFGYSF